MTSEEFEALCRARKGRRIVPEEYGPGNPAPPLKPDVSPPSVLDGPTYGFAKAVGLGFRLLGNVFAGLMAIALQIAMLAGLIWLIKALWYAV